MRTFNLLPTLNSTNSAGLLLSTWLVIIKSQGDWPLKTNFQRIILDLYALQQSYQSEKFIDINKVFHVHD